MANPVGVMMLGSTLDAACWAAGSTVFDIPATTHRCTSNIASPALTRVWKESWSSASGGGYWASAEPSEIPKKVWRKCRYVVSSRYPPSSLWIRGVPPSVFTCIWILHLGFRSVAGWRCTLGQSE
jgi:hypothetical protein